MKDFNIEERVKKAVENFESGYNCAQSVFLAYADVFELDLEIVVDTLDQEARTRNYAIVQKMGSLFKEEFGTIICRELLPPTEASQTSPTPSIRNAAYYSSRPCGHYVAKAAEIAGKMLKGELE